MTQPQEVPEQGTPQELSALILASLTAWLALVLPAVLATGFPNPLAIFQFEQFWTSQVDRWMPVLARLARPGWNRTASELGVSIPWRADDPYLQEILDRTRNLLVGIPDRVYREVIKAMADGRDRGESNAQISARVSKILDVNGSANWPHRADVVARTELNRFTEAGALAAARSYTARTGRQVLKQWKDRDDSRVRLPHSRVDKRRQRLGEPFEVGRSLLQQPLDPAGFPEDVINCRCRLEYVEVNRGR